MDLGFSTGIPQHGLHFPSHPARALLTQQVTGPAFLLTPVLAANSSLVQKQEGERKLALSRRGSEGYLAIPGVLASLG